MDVFWNFTSFVFAKNITNLMIVFLFEIKWTKVKSWRILLSVIQIRRWKDLCVFTLFETIFSDVMPAICCPLLEWPSPSSSLFLFIFWFAITVLYVKDLGMYVHSEVTYNHVIAAQNIKIRFVNTSAHLW